MYNYQYSNVPQQQVYQQPTQPVQYGGYAQAAPPVNTTRSGISYDQIRTDLANTLNFRKDNDIAAQAFFNECSGMSNNFLTGRMDRLVNMCAITTDYLCAQNPYLDVNQHYGNAIEETWRFGWVATIQNNYHMLNDPSLNNERGNFQNWVNQMNNRFNELNNSGLLTPQAPPVYHQPIPNNQFGFNQPRPFPQYQSAMNTPTMMNNNTQTWHYNQNNVTTQPTWNQPRQQYTAGISTTQNFNGNKPQMSFAETHKSNGGHLVDIYSIRVNPEVEEKRKRWKGPLDRYGNPDYTKIEELNLNPDGTPKDGTPSYADLKAQATQSAQQGYIETTVTANTVSNEKRYTYQNDPEHPLRANVPPEAMARWNARVLAETPPGQKPKGYVPMMEEVNNINTVPEKRPVIPAAFTAVPRGSDAVREIDITDERTMQQIFTEVVKEETKTDGLLTDELCTLDKDEVHRLWMKGYKFEQNPQAPITGNPFHVYIHYTLLANNTIRCIITEKKDEEKMRLSKHQCILAPLRQDRPLIENVNAPKTWMVTHKGDQTFDRFTASAVKLADELRAHEEKLVSEETPQDERQNLVDNAFDAFEEQAKVDFRDYHDGFQTWAQTELAELEEMRTDESEPLPTYDELREDSHFTQDMKDRIFERNMLNVDAVYLSEVMEAASPEAAVTKLQEAVIKETVPELEDQTRIAIFKERGIFKLFNSPRKLREAKEVLQLFFWNTNMDDDDLELQKGITPRLLAEFLRKGIDDMPMDIWVRLNTMATRYVNDALRYTLCDTISIDSFAHDWEDLRAYYSTPESLAKFPNIDTALGVMGCNLLLELQILFDFNEEEFESSKQFEDEFGINHMEQRALTYTRPFEQAMVPTYSTAAGLTQSIEVITEKSNRSLYRLCTAMAVDQIKSRLARHRADAPISRLFVAFNDGVIYRVYPRCNDVLQAVDKSTASPEELVPAFTLVRQP